MPLAIERASFIPRRRGSRIAAFLWFAVCVCVFILAACRNGDRAGLALTYASVVLTFPACFLAIAIAVAFSSIASLISGAPLPETLASLAAFWALVTIMGYVQWFVIVPWLLRKLNAP
jgi:hypothetical protein